jgi:DNA-binding NarL/FixJ family response regulator
VVGRPDHATPIRVMIIEDHPVVAEGLSSLLTDYPDLEVVAGAMSVAEVSRALAAGSPDVAVVDFHLPDGTGADAADVIRARSGSTAIVFLSADDTDEPLLAAIEAGASNYLLKSSTGEEIVHSIRAAAAGETLIPAATIAAALARRREIDREQASQAQLLARLTPREKEILGLMIHGADNRAVAERLQISYATVRTHVRSILTKLDARSQLDAVAKAVQLGLRGLGLGFGTCGRAVAELVSGSGPGEGLAAVGPGVDDSRDRGAKARVGAASGAAARAQAGEDLRHCQPCSLGRGEVLGYPGVPGQPSSYFRVPASRVVVDGDDVQFGARAGPSGLLQEVQVGPVPSARVIGGGDGSASGDGPKRGEQFLSAVPAALVSRPQHDRMVRRVEVQPGHRTFDHGQLRIGGEPERLAPPGLQPVLPPCFRDLHVRHAQLAGKKPGRPVLHC